MPAAAPCGGLRPNRLFRMRSLEARFQLGKQLNLETGGFGRFGIRRDVTRHCCAPGGGDTLELDYALVRSMRAASFTSTAERDETMDKSSLKNTWAAVVFALRGPARGRRRPLAKQRYRPL